MTIALSYNSQSASAFYEPFGNKWQFNYASYLTVDPGGAATIFMPDGRRDVYMPDGGDGYTSPYRVYTTLSQVADNHFELTFPDGTVYAYRFPEGTSIQQTVLTSVRDAYGQALTFGYTPEGRLTTITDAVGQITTLTYNAETGLVERVDDPVGRSAFFEYDADRNLTMITDMGGYWTSLAYDADVYVSAIETARGRWEVLVEPADGVDNESNPYPAPGDAMWENARITITNPEGGREEYYYEGYSGYGWSVSPRDYWPYHSPSDNNHRLAVKTCYDYTQTSGTSGPLVQGEIRQITFPEGGTLLYDYSGGATGERTGVTNALGATTFTYNSLGRVTSITPPEGETTTLTYAPNGVDLTQISTGLGTITLTYNAAHDVTAITDRLGHVTEFDYNASGQLLRQREYLNGAPILTEYLYNAHHQVERVRRAGQELAAFTYDPIGRVQTATDATGLTLTYAYTDLNHVTAVTSPDGRAETAAYSDCCPRLVDSVTDRAGRTTSFLYDRLKRLIRTTTPEGGVLTYAYDPNSNLLSFTDSEQHTTSFAYNLDNRLTRKTYHDGTFVVWAYNAAGLPQTFTNARHTTAAYSYDANGRLTRVSYDDEGGTLPVSSTYDAYGRRVAMTDGLGAWTFGYDANSQLISVDGPWEADTVTYEYDALGRIIQRIPQGGTAVNYVYDALNRLTQIQRGAATFTYTYSGVNPLVQRLTRPNGSVTDYQYTALNQLANILNRTSTGAVLSQHTYSYDAQDLRSTETFDGPAIPPLPAVPNTTTTSTTNAVNQLLSTAAPDRTFLYDADGNLTQGYTKEGYVFTARHDAENRMTSLEYTDSSGVRHRQHFRYSGHGLLADQRYVLNDGILVNYTRLVRGGMLPIQDRDINNTVLREYTWGLNLGGGIGGLLNLNSAGQNYAYLYDGTGNVQAVLNAAQQVVAAYRYDPFGVLLAKTGSFEQPYGFSTKRYNAPIGMVHYEFRNYFPELARWDSRDPIGEAGGLNLYAFVGNNPVNWVDPWGWELISALVGQRVLQTAIDNWGGTPYLFGGDSSTGIDCSHFVYRAFMDAELPYEYSDASSFPNNPMFIEILPTMLPQAGDVVVLPGHIGLYAPNPPTSGYTLYGATSSEGVRYGDPGWWNGTPRYFRYNEPRPYRH